MRIIALILLLSGCIPHKKLAEICAEKYPVQKEVYYDTIKSIDTIRIKTEHIDTFILKEKEVILKTEVKESTAKLELERQKKAKELKALYDYDMKIILDLNRAISRLEKDSANINYQLRKKDQEIASIRLRLQSANKFKWFFYGGLVVLFGLVIRWFKPRLF